MRPIHYHIALSLLFGWTSLVFGQTNTPAWHRKLTLPDLILGPLQQGQERVAVIVTLVPNARAKQRTDWNKAQSVQTLRAANRADSAAVLKDVAANERRVRHEFDNQAGFSCELTQRAIEKLANDPRVAAIEPVLELQMHLNQGIALMNALTTRSTYTGTNLAIAICDTGIDYTHPRLGGGGFPNTKVIGGYDYGNNDANPLPVGEAHGTACAGIAAGDLGTVGDYIGGVAPGAKLYALKISPDSSGSASSDAMIAAWDWCVTHKNDDPANPILVISTSFGGGRYFSSCDGTSPGMTAAANNAVAAGITVLVSSGNDGYCDSMGWPACISSVISVGAVYDANFGTYQPCLSSDSCAPKTLGGCTSGAYATDATAADKVTSYSNTANFLGVLAPANQCYTADITGSSGYNTTAGSGGDYTSGFGGTSAACPYAAGAVACLQHAAKTINGTYLTPSEVKTLLTSTGDLIADTKVAVTKPRVNLGNAISNLAGPTPALSLTNATASDVGGNANGFIDPGETILETIVWKNTGTAPASNLTGTLLTTTAGVTLTQPAAAFANAPSGGTTTNSVPFAYRLAKSVACGTTLVFTNVITSSPGGRAFTGTFSRVVGQLQNGGAVTNTFDSTNIPKAILDNTTLYSTNVIALAGIIDDINVTVRLDHTWDDDLVLAIEHPDTTEILLAENYGGNGNNYGTGTCGAGEVRTTFDDAAATAISAGSPPFAGSYRPDVTLSNLNGKAVSGTWRLRVTDISSRDTGTLNCWGLRIISHSTSHVCSLYNTPPVASNRTFTIGAGSTTNFTLSGSDPDGDVITFQTNSLPVHGTITSFTPLTGAISYTATGGYSGPDSFTFIASDGYSNSLAGTVSFTISGGSCNYAITPATNTVPVNAASTNFTVTTTTGCLWTASSPDPWINVTSPGSSITNSGSDSATYTVAANSGSPRTGTVVAAGITHTVIQTGCGFDLGTSSTNTTANGEGFTFDVSTTGSACAWTTTADVGWITNLLPPTGSSVTNSSAVSFTVVGNTSGGRTGHVTAAGLTFTVTQDGCGYSLNTNTTAVSLNGINFTNFLVNAAGTACTWTASTPDSWITDLYPAAGTGTAAVVFSALPNGGSSRTGTVTAAGIVHTVIQTGCEFSLATNITTVGVDGINLTNFLVTASGTACTWAAAVDVPWITGLVPTNATGTSGVFYSVLANPDGPARTGLVTAAGIMHTVAQDGCEFSLAPTNTTYPAFGGAGSLTVSTTGTACLWTATSPAAWIINITPTNGAGSGVILYTVLTNTVPTPRTAVLTIAGQTHTVDQAAGLTAFEQWQLDNFGCTNCSKAAANADPDGDGQSNEAEFLTGFTPTNGASFFHITSVAEEGLDIRVTWLAGGGRTNVVQSTASLTTNFTDISSLYIIPAGSAVLTNHLDSGGATNTPSLFYRIRLEP